MSNLFRLLIFLLFLFCASLTFSQNGNLRIKNQTIDLGKLREGDIIDVDYLIENTSTSSIKIYSVATFCGCTTPKYPKEIGPNQKVIISAKFNSTGFLGSILSNRSYYSARSSVVSLINVIFKWRVDFCIFSG